MEAIFASHLFQQTARDDATVIYLVGIGWMYVVLLMTVAEALSANGSVLGAIITFFLYGVLPLSILLYILATPARRRALRARDAAASAVAAPSAAQPDGSRHAAGDAISPVGKEP